MASYLTQVQIQLADITSALEALATKERSVRDLLAKADKKRRTPGEDVRKWSLVLNNLEHSLDDVRRRQTILENDLRKSRQSLSWAQENPGEVPREEGSKRSKIPATTQSGALPLNLEQMSEIEGRLHPVEAQPPEAQPPDAERERIEGEVEFANQTREASTEAQPIRRQQHRLRAALDKIQQRQFSALSREELQMTIATHSLLSRKLDMNENDQRLLAILETAVTLLREQLTQSRGGR